MVPLNQLFRHRSEIRSAGAAAERAESGAQSQAGSAPVQPAEAAARGLGAIAAAVGVRADRGMPPEFEFVLGDLLARVPAEFVWPGRHDVNRVLRVAASEIAVGLVRGRAEISLARLVALAPDVFRWERGDSDDPRVRLNLQKVLEQIGRGGATPAPPAAPDPAVVTLPVGVSSGGTFAARPADEVMAHLPSSHFGKGEPAPAVQSPVPKAEAAGPVPTVPASAVPAGSGAPQSAQTPASGPSAPAEEPYQEGVKASPMAAAGSGAARRFLAPEISSSPGVAAGVVLRPVQTVAQAVPKPAVSAAPPPVAPAPAQKTAQPRPAEPPPSTTASPPVGPNFTALQQLFMTDASLDLIGAAVKAAALPGIHAVFISGAAGTAEIGHIPSGLDAQMLRDLTRDFAGKCGEAGSCTGAVSTTLQRDDCTIAIFVRDGIRLCVVLDARGFVAGVRERMVRMTAYLAGAPSAE